MIKSKLLREPLSNKLLQLYFREVLRLHIPSEGEVYNFTCQKTITAASCLTAHELPCFYHRTVSELITNCRSIKCILFYYLPHGRIELHIKTYEKSTENIPPCNKPLSHCQRSENFSIFNSKNNLALWDGANVMNGPLRNRNVKKHFG